MRNTFLIAFFALFLGQMFGQVELKESEFEYTAPRTVTKLGIKLQYSSFLTSPQTSVFQNKSTGAFTQINYIDTKPNLGVGLWMRNQFGWLYSDASLIYNKIENNYTINNFRADDVKLSLYSDNFQFVSAQVIAGINHKNFHFGVGPVISFLANYIANDIENQSFSVQNRDIYTGFSGAIGFDTGRVSIDLKYDKSFSKTGENMFVGTRKVNLNTSPDALTLSVAYQIF